MSVHISQMPMLMRVQFHSVATSSACASSASAPLSNFVLVSSMTSAAVVSFIERMVRWIERSQRTLVRVQPGFAVRVVFELPWLVTSAGLVKSCHDLHMKIIKLKPYRWQLLMSLMYLDLFPTSKCCKEIVFLVQCLRSHWLEWLNKLQKCNLRVRLSILNWGCIRAQFSACCYSSSCWRLCLENFRGLSMELFYADDLLLQHPAPSVHHSTQYSAPSHAMENEQWWAVLWSWINIGILKEQWFECVLILNTLNIEISILRL